MIVLRYLSRDLFVAIAVALLALVTLHSVIDFISEVNDADGGGYTVYDAIAYTLLNMVVSAHELFPIAVLIGSVISLSGLAERFELLALEALGYSRRRFGLITAGVGVILMSVMFLFGEIIASTAADKAYVIKFAEQARQSFHRTANGNWTRIGANYIFFKPTAAGGRDARVYLINSSHRLERIIRAHRIRLGANRISLEDATLISLNNNAMHEIRRRPYYDIATGIGATQATIPQAMNVLQLHQYSDFLHRSSMNNDLYELAFWSRFSAVLAVPIMLLLALAWVTNPLSDARSKPRIFIAILLGIGYILLSRTVGSASIAWNFMPQIGAFLPTVVFGLIGLLMLKYSPR